MFKKQHVHRMCVVEMKMIRLISWNIRKHRIQNEEICLIIGVALKRWEKLTEIGYVQGFDSSRANEKWWRKIWNNTSRNSKNVMLLIREVTKKKKNSKILRIKLYCCCSVKGLNWRIELLIKMPWRT